MEEDKAKLDTELFFWMDMRFLALCFLIFMAIFAVMSLANIFHDGFDAVNVTLTSVFFIVVMLYLYFDSKIFFLREKAIKLACKEQEEWLSSEAGIAWQKEQKRAKARAQAEKARKEEWERTRPRSCARDGHEWRLSHQGVDKKWPRQHYKCFRCGATKVDEN